MKLNHVNLTVTDVGPAHDFLVKHFGLRSPHGVKPNAPLAVLFDDDGLVLTLIRAAAGTDVTYPPSFHVGFIQPSPERVNEIHQRLRADGIEAEAPHRAHGAWTFYFVAPGGFTIEVLC